MSYEKERKTALPKHIRSVLNNNRLPLTTAFWEEGKKDLITRRAIDASLIYAMRLRTAFHLNNRGLYGLLTNTWTTEEPVLAPRALLSSGKRTYAKKHLPLDVFNYHAASVGDDLFMTLQADLRDELATPLDPSLKPLYEQHAALTQKPQEKHIMDGVATAVRLYRQVTRLGLLKFYKHYRRMPTGEEGFELGMANEPFVLEAARGPANIHISRLIALAGNVQNGDFVENFWNFNPRTLQLYLTEEKNWESLLTPQEEASIDDGNPITFCPAHVDPHTFRGTILEEFVPDLRRFPLLKGNINTIQFYYRLYLQTLYFDHEGLQEEIPLEQEGRWRAFWNWFFRKQ